MRLYEELKRRNVFRVAIAYVVLAWVLLQVTDVVLPILELPDWTAKLVLFLLAIGFPLALIFAWAFELTPEGLKLEKDVDRKKSITAQTGKKLDRIIIGILVIAVALLLLDRFREDTATRDDPDDGIATDIVGFEKSVAVLPFTVMSSGADDEYFADGLTEEILNALAQLPELLVTSRTSAFSFRGTDVPLADVAARLGVRHIVEGSVRKSGERLRVTAQLIRAEDGFHLWSQNYDRNPADTIAVQQDIAEQIAIALDVVLDDRKRNAMWQAGLKDVEAFTEYQKAVDLFERAHGELPQVATLQQANQHYENVLARVPSYGPAYVDHSDLFVHVLISDVSGLPMPGLSADFIDSAMQNAIDDYSAAVRYARNPQERHVWEYDLAMLSGNWQGLAGRLEHVFNDAGCESGNWVAPVAAIFGFARDYLAVVEKRLECDPLVPTMWFNRIRAALWSGEAELAVRFARQGSEVAPGGWVNHAHVRALVATGDFEGAERIIASRIQTDLDALIAHIFLAAAKGDAEEAASRLAAYQQHPLAGDFYNFLYYAWTGDRETVNRMAADIDRHPFRHHVLTLLAYWCACGAAFDLDATPNYAAKLEEAGFSWPPASPIEFPLKDW